MVDFNNETTIATPSVDVVRILILQRRNDVIEAFEHYKKTDNEEIEVIQARLLSLYLELQGLIDKQKDSPKNNIEVFSTKIFEADFGALLKIFSGINMLLYNINLTKIDNKPDYDTTDIEAENKKQSL